MSAHACRAIDPETGAPYATPAVVTCGADETHVWCERCDPAPSALCHWCNGRGVSIAPLGPVVSCGHRAQPTFYSGAVTVGSERVDATGRVMFPGYAVLPDARKVCPECADEIQRQEMRTAPRFTAYLSADGRTVTSWTGGSLARVTRTTRNARQTFIRATDSYGHKWAGIGPAETGTYVSLRRVKG